MQKKYVYIIVTALFLPLVLCVVAYKMMREPPKSMASLEQGNYYGQYFPSYEAYDLQSKKMRMGSDIAEDLGIHHPLLRDSMQRDFSYFLTQGEIQRSERILRDLIGHSVRMVFTKYSYSDSLQEKTMISDEYVKKRLAKSFSFQLEKPVYIGPRTVRTDVPLRSLQIFPNGITFVVFSQSDDDECTFVLSWQSGQTLEGHFNREFIKQLLEL